MNDTTHTAPGTTSGVLRLAVFISGSGTNLQAIIDAIENNQLPGVEIALVISNRADAYGLQRALQHGCPTVYIPWTKKSQQSQAEEYILQLLRIFSVDLIMLAGWLRIFSPTFFLQCTQPMLNLHPALLPDDGTATTYTTSDGTIIPALRGLHVVRDAIEAGLSITGSTIHYVIPAVDAGPVIARSEVAILPEDTEEILQERIKLREHQLIIEALTAYMTRDRDLIAH